MRGGTEYLLNSNSLDEPVSRESLMPVNSFNSVLQSYQQYTQGEIAKQAFSVSVVIPFGINIAYRNATHCF